MRLKIKIKIKIKTGTQECETRQAPRDRSFQFGALG